MADGQFQTGKPNRPPTFVWRMPITRQRHQLIHEYVMQRKYDQFGVRSNNCTDMVVEAAALAGINLIHRIRLTAAAGNEGFWVGRCVSGRIPNTAYWSTARPTFWKRTCASLPGWESGVMLRSGTWL